MLKAFARETIQQRLTILNRQHYTTYTETARRIVRGCSTDLEKAYAIYVWIAQNIAYDTQRYFAKHYVHDGLPPAEKTFKERKSVCEGYAHLFTAMGTAVGLKVETISGWSKGFGYVPGNPLSADPDHAWNAIFIDQQWRLLDVTWGAGTIDKKTKAFTFGFNEEWFCMPADHFVYTHLPADARWQGLSDTISQEQFLALPKVTTSFFKYGFTLGNIRGNYSAKIKQLVIHIVPPTDIVCMASIETLAGKKLPDEHILMRNHPTGYIFQVTAPYAGDYVVHIFGCPKNTKQSEYNQVYTLPFHAPEDVSRQRFFEVYSPYIEQPIVLLGETPVAAVLFIDTEYHFHVQVPNAISVELITDPDSPQKKWITLEKKDNSFQGVYTPTFSTKAVRLAAQYTTDGPYEGLCAYTVTKKTIMRVSFSR